jgi:hypothetical protein
MNRILNFLLMTSSHSLGRRIGLLFVLSFWLFSFPVQAQISKGFLIKTLVFQDAIYRNPNLIIEKRISPKFSVEIQGAVRNGALVPNTTEGIPAPNLHDCEGFTAGISVRYFFVKGRTSPNSWYVSGILRYNDIELKNESVGNHLSRVVNISRTGPELGVLIGRQFLIGKFISTEFYLGAGAYRQVYKEEFVSGDLDGLVPKDVLLTFRPYLGWTVGFFFPW